MTETPTEPTEENDDWIPSVQLNIYTGDAIQMRTIALGLQKMILIEPNLETEDFDVHFSLGDMPTEMAVEMLEYIVGVIKNGEIVKEEVRQV